MMDDKMKYPPFEICEKVLFIMAAEVFNILITHNVKLTGITVNCHNLLMTVTVTGKHGSNYRLSLSCNRKSKKLNLTNLFNSQQ